MAKIGGDMYRIGDYSRFMGVSPDLLKHYERCGLIKPMTAENGYRYYRFFQSTRLLDCMRLRNYGFSLNEMQTLLNDLPYEGVKERLDAQIDKMEAELLFRQRVIAEHRRISEWMEMMSRHEFRLESTEAEAVYFLPQSQENQFIQDERIAQLLERWVAAMPIVKSCRLFEDVLADDAVRKGMWGLAARESDVRALGLPVNDAVIRVEGGSSHLLHIHYLQHHGQKAAPYLTAVQKTLRGCGVQEGTPALQFMLMSLACGEASHESCGCFLVSRGNTPCK